jgi:lysophospholipase L1-like esterase
MRSGKSACQRRQGVQGWLRRARIGIFRRGHGCAGYSASDVDDFDSLTDTLNSAIRRAASRVPGVKYVDAADVFDGHEICSENPWVVAPLKFTLTIGRHDWLHPNTAGQEAIAKLVAKAIQG